MPSSALAVVPPADWVKATEHMLARRGEDMKEIDRLYEMYHRSRSDENALRLHAALSKYLLAHGGHWEKVERNKKSGGLMEHIWKSTRDHAGLRPHADPGQKALADRIPEARHGVVYLWGNTTVRTEWMKIVLAGAIDLGGSLGSGLAGDVGVIKGDTAKKAVSGVTDYGLPVASPIGLAEQVKDIKANLPPTGVVTPNAVLGRVDPANALQRAKAFLGKFFDAVWDAINRMARAIRDKVVMSWASGDMDGAIAKVFTKVVVFVVGKVAEAAAPFVSGGIDIAKGLVATALAIKDRAQAGLTRRKFVIAPGHPHMISDAILYEMDWDIGRGVYTSLKGAGNLALSGVGFGFAGSIANLVVSFAEFIYKFFKRIVEAAKIRKWVDKVTAASRDKKDDPGSPGTKRPAICFDTTGFNKLFEDGCNASSCVPMLTLNSGICGDHMMFMKMFADTGGVIGQPEFDAGTRYWQQMKVYGRKYLGATGFQFGSGLPDVNGYLQHAVSHHQDAPPKGFKGLIERGATGFAS